MAHPVHYHPALLAAAVLLIVASTTPASRAEQAAEARPEAQAPAPTGRYEHEDTGLIELFDDSVISEIRLQIPPASWQAIDDEALSGCVATPRDYYPGAVTINGVEFPGSGIRAKGGCGSSRTLDGKAAFKANMSWDDPAVPGCAETRRIKGIKKITLNNQVEDASFVHERIGYDFFRKLGVPVPRAAPARLYVNDELWGLYLHLETIDRHFLAHRFASNDGMLYEGDYGCDLGEAACFEPKFDTDECDKPRDGDPTDMTPLETLHERLAQIPSDDFYPAIEQVFNFDSYLTTWAAAAVLGYWDGYPNDPTNYRIYHDVTDDRWTLIPSGIDQVLEKSVNPFRPVGMLSIRCLEDADCAAAFEARLVEVIDRFEAQDYGAMAKRIAAQTRAEVEADPRKEITVDEWREAVGNTVQYIQRRPGELRALLAERANRMPREAFHFHALTDPNGKRFIFVTWTLPGNGAGSPTRWLTAKGYFEQLTARLEAVELAGGSSAGRPVGTVDVDFVDCETAHFSYTPTDPLLPGQERTAHIDSEIWKYCD
jgi:hypothetical protein